MKSVFLETVILLWLSSALRGHPSGGSHLIIGTLVRLRRAALADSSALTTEDPELMAATASDNGGGDAAKNTTKDDDLSGLDNKILLLMIVPPDKIKPRLVANAKNKKKTSRSVISRGRVSKAQCATELQKKLEIAENLAKQLLTNSSMALLASQADTKNAAPLISKISGAIESKIRYVSDVRPVINCDDSCDTTTKETTTTTTAPTTQTTSKPTEPPSTTTNPPGGQSSTPLTIMCDTDTTKPSHEANRKSLTPARKPATPKLRVAQS